jgi:hypothetical protein
VTADQDRTDRAGTEIASQFLNTYMEGLTSTKDTMDGQNAYGYRLSALRPAVADVLAYHINDLQTAVGTHAGPLADTAAGAHGTHSVTLRGPVGLASLFADLAADRPGDLANLDVNRPNAMQVVLRAQLLYSAERLKAAAAGGDLGSQAASTSTVLSYMLASAELGMTEMGKSDDERDLLLRGFLAQGAATVPVGKIPGAGQVAGVAYNKATEYLLSRAMPANSVAEQARSNLGYQDVFRHLAKEQIEVALGQAGNWPEGVSPEEWVTANGYPKRSFFQGDDGNPLQIQEMTSDQYSAYLDWRNDSVTGAGGIYGPPMNEAAQMNLVGRDDAQNDYSQGN